VSEPGDTFEALPPTATTDRECVPITTCDEDAEYATPTHNRHGRAFPVLL